MNETPAVILNIQRQPGANIISVVDRIKNLLPQLTSSLPASIHVSILTDRTTTIRASVSDVQFELMLTVALVVMVMFLFLRNLAATIIPSIAVPLSLVATFGVMYLLGYSLNNLTLMALTISTGFVVDDAIVMIENITRYIEEGDTSAGGRAQRLRADRLHHRLADRLPDRRSDPSVVHGRYRGPPVSRIRRYPERDHPGVGGGFAHPDSDDVLQAPEAHAGGEAGTLLSRLRARLQCGHRLLRQDAASGCWAGRCMTLLVAAGTLALTIFLFFVIPKGFFPIQDTGVIQGVSEAAQSVSFPEMSSAAAAADQDHSAGSGRRQSVLLHRNRRDQHHLEQRAHSDQPEADRCSARSAPATSFAACSRTGEGAGHHAVHAAGAGSFGRRPREPHPVPVHARRPQRRRTEYLTRRRCWPSCSSCRELSDVASDQQVLGLRAKLVFDRDTASRLGITTSAIDQTLYDAYGQREVSTMFTQLNQYHVVLEVKPGFEKNPSSSERSVYPRRPREPRGIDSQPSVRPSVESICGMLPNGGQIPLSAFSHVETDHGSHHREPPGPVSGGDAVFQSGAGRIAGRRRQGREQSEGRNGHAAEHSGRLSGHGRSVPGVVGQRAGADCRGADYGLSGPGHPV